jgi:amidohydrolase
MDIEGDVIAQMIALRRELHQFPELANHEFRTQATIRAALEAAGLTAIGTIAGTGLFVDVLGTAGRSNRKIAIRGDIDALPITEESGEPFTSANRGIMHACGHDAHASMVFAAAHALHRHRSHFRGTVRFIFQPAEEDEPLGGRRVVEEGGIDDVEAVVGIHVDPDLDTGRIAVPSGSVTLACDTFDTLVRGVSSHAARPHEGVDAIAIGAAIVSEVQKIVSREADPATPLVISVTGFSGGGAYNIIADSARLNGTIRSATEIVRQYAHRRLHEIAGAVAAAHQGGVSVEIRRGEPSVVNDGQMVHLIETAARRAAGPHTLISATGWTMADDFGFYAERRPSVYFRLGIRNPDRGISFPLHHPKFIVDESAMVLGLKVLTEAAMLYLQSAESDTKAN